jgi:hypothetical protein
MVSITKCFCVLSNYVSVDKLQKKITKAPAGVKSFPSFYTPKKLFSVFKSAFLMVFFLLLHPSNNKGFMKNLKQNF